MLPIGAADMDADRKDSVVTIAAIGLLAYASADVTHHALGHGAACLVLGGQIVFLSSSYVHCSLRGATIDLAGPLANLVLGLGALLAARMTSSRSSATRLFLVLVAAFNLLWLTLQLVFSAATRTDDWAWAMHQLHVGAPIRIGMIVVGIVCYAATVRACAVQLAQFGHPRARLGRIVLTAWLTAGALATATAAFDPSAGAVLVRHVLEQSLGLSIGLLFVPVRASRLASPEGEAALVPFSWVWVAAAAMVGAASVALLGPGIAIAI